MQGRTHDSKTSIPDVIHPNKPTGRRSQLEKISHLEYQKLKNFLAASWGEEIDKTMRFAKKNPTITNEKGHTLLDVAVLNGHVYLAEQLSNENLRITKSIATSTDLSAEMKEAIRYARFVPCLHPITQHPIEFEEELKKLAGYYNSRVQTCSSNINNLRLCLEYDPKLVNTNITYSTSTEYTEAFAYAVRHCSPEVVDLFVEYGAKLSEFSLWTAETHIAMLQHLITRHRFGQDKYYNIQLLMSLLRSTEVIRSVSLSEYKDELLAAFTYLVNTLKFDWRCEDVHDQHAFLYSSYQDSVIYVCLGYFPEALPLLCSQPEVTIDLMTNKTGRTALHQLASWTVDEYQIPHQLQRLTIIFQYKPDPTLKNKEGKTALQIACEIENYVFAYRLFQYMRSTLKPDIFAMELKKLSISSINVLSYLEKHLELINANQQNKEIGLNKDVNTTLLPRPSLVSIIRVLGGSPLHAYASSRPNSLGSNELISNSINKLVPTP